MALHFSREELKARRDETIARLRERGLDGLLMFRQESMFYLTGYDTFGYCFFQCLYLDVDGRMALLTRAPDLRQARHTSVVEDVRVWIDRENHNPATDLVELLREYGCRDQRLGIELEAYGLTGSSWRRVEQALEGFCEWEDVSLLVSEQRVVKSEAELEYVRRAAELADDAFDAALKEIQPGAFEGDVLAVMHDAIFRGGGDYAGNEFVIGAGHDALLCRYFTGRKHLQEQDQLTLEWAGAYRHYHSAMMRTIPIGSVAGEHVSMHGACVDAMHASLEKIQPGNCVGDIFDAHAATLDAAGFHDHRLNACGYGLGTTYTPTWMDWPMLCTGNSLELKAGMVFFLNMVLMNSHTEHAMTLGTTVVVTRDGPEMLSRHSFDLITA